MVIVQKVVTIIYFLLCIYMIDSLLGIVRYVICNSLHNLLRWVWSFMFREFKWLAQGYPAIGTARSPTSLSPTASPQWTRQYEMTHGLIIQFPLGECWGEWRGRSHIWFQESRRGGRSVHLTTPFLCVMRSTVGNGEVMGHSSPEHRESNQFHPGCLAWKRTGISGFQFPYIKWEELVLRLLLFIQGSGGKYWVLLSFTSGNFGNSLSDPMRKKNVLFMIPPKLVQLFNGGIIIEI